VSGHTPGPWFVASGNNYATEITATSKRGKKWVIARATASKTGQEEAKANARLIAAAPELLAELKSMIAAARSAGWDNAEIANAEEAVEQVEGKQ